MNIITPNEKRSGTPLNAPMPSRGSFQKANLSYIPSAFVPYAELMRIDKPIAFLYLYFPCFFGTFMVAATSDPLIQPGRLATVNLILALGCFLVRCAGCSWNDIVDQDIDRKVSRTRNRPIARRAISTSAALVFTTVQVAAGLGLVWILLPSSCLSYSVPSMLLTALYPYAKRFTYYPQLVLGCVFSWGVILAFPALEVDLVTSQPRVLISTTSLYLSCIAWTMSYDTIYAAQDIKDDIAAAVKSPVVKHQNNTRRLLIGANVVQIVLLVCTGIAAEATSVFYLCSCIGTAVILWKQVILVDLADPRDCLWWFKKGSFYVGIILGSGFVGEYLIRLGYFDTIALLGSDFFPVGSSYEEFVHWTLWK